MSNGIRLYRVRKSFRDFKSQKGVFFTFSAAVKAAEKWELNVYNNEGRELYSAESGVSADLCDKNL